MNATIDELKAERDRLSWLCQIMRPPPAGAWARVVELEAQIDTLRRNKEEEQAA